MALDMHVAAVSPAAAAPEPEATIVRRHQRAPHADRAELSHQVSGDVPEPLREAVKAQLTGAAALHYEHVDTSGERVAYQAQGVMELASGRRLGVDVRAEVDGGALAAAAASGSRLSVASVRTTATALGVKIALDLDGDGTPDRVTTVIAADVDADHEARHLLGRPQ
jgi:hypothetical protein